MIFTGAFGIHDFDVEIRLIAWDFLVKVAMLGIVSGVDPDDPIGGHVSATVRDRI